jgi:hypothetical protein
MSPATISLKEREVLDAVLDRLNSSGWQRVDALESFMESMPEFGVQMPLRHIFTPGLYTREIFIPANTIATTRIHLCEHPFVLLKGTVYVWTEESGWAKFVAPFMGITQPGTRRVLYTTEDVVWVTFHATDKKDPDDVVREVTFCEGKYDQLGIAAASDRDLTYHSTAALS